MSKAKNTFGNLPDPFAFKRGDARWTFRVHDDDGNDPVFAWQIIALYIGIAVMVVCGCCYQRPKTYHSETVLCPMCSSEIPHVEYHKGAE